MLAARSFSIADRLIPIFAVCLLAALMLFQGGFFSDSSIPIESIFGSLLFVLLMVRVVGSASARVSHRAIGEMPSKVSAGMAFVPVGFLCIALLYCMSSLVHGLPIGSLLQSVPWLLASLTSLSIYAISPDRRRWTMVAVGWLGVLSAWFGIGIMSGLLPIEGALHVGRLQFTFQYANAAGAWFACSSLICMRTEDFRLQRLLLCPLSALLLTQSIGSIVLFGAIAATCLLASCVKRKAAGEGANGSARYFGASFLVQMLISILVFVGFKSGLDMAEGIGAISFAALSLAFYKLWPAARRSIGNGSGTRAFKLVAAILVSLLCVGMLVIFLYLIGARLSQASGTIVERAEQSIDALRLLLMNPILGVGPDQWQYLYPSVQTADYESTLVHCGYLQIGLDAGIPAMLLVLALLIVGIIRSAKGRQSCAWPPIAFLALHSFIDFDLMFAFFPVLLGLLLSVASDRRKVQAQKG